MKKTTWQSIKNRPKPRLSLGLVALWVWLSIGLFGCQSGINLKPLFVFSDESAVLLTKISLAHAKEIELQTRDGWLLCQELPPEFRVNCRQKAVEKAFADNREITVALHDAARLQRVLAATLETASVCVATTNEGQKCEQDAWNKAIAIYPDLRALILKLQKGKK